MPDVLAERLKPPSGRKVSDEQILQKLDLLSCHSNRTDDSCVCVYMRNLPVNIQQHLNQAIIEFELVHQRKPQKLIVTWEVRAELERQQALPDMMIENSLAEWPVLRVE